MAYDGDRSYISASIAAGNVVSTASGAVAASSTSVLLPAAEATFIVSIGAVVTATPSNPPAGVKPYVVIGTTTTTGATSIAQSSASAAFISFSNLALTQGQPFTVGLVGTGTASATETAGAVNLTIGLAPQFV